MGLSCYFQNSFLDHAGRKLWRLERSNQTFLWEPFAVMSVLSTLRAESPLPLDCLSTHRAVSTLMIVNEQIYWTEIGTKTTRKLDTKSTINRAKITRLPRLECSSVPPAERTWFSFHRPLHWSCLFPPSKSSQCQAQKTVKKCKRCKDAEATEQEQNKEQQSKHLLHKDARYKSAFQTFFFSANFVKNLSGEGRQLWFDWWGGGGLQQDKRAWTNIKQFLYLDYIFRQRSVFRSNVDLSGLVWS